MSRHNNNGSKFARLLTEKIDSVMEKAKIKRKNNPQHFCRDKGKPYKDDLICGLKSALEGKELFLCYQPLIDSGTQKVVALEALIRWKRPGNGIVAPLDFIPIAEKSELIVSIGEWVLETACRQLKEWQEEGATLCSIAVNVSVKQIKRPDFTEVVAKILSKTGLLPNYLVLEITESSYFEPIEMVLENINILRSMGIKISLDDFGTGYNTLKTIQNFSVDSLKIDRAFINNINAEVNKVIVETILLLGRRIHVNTVAEGVETKEQYEYLKRMGCDIIQGYYFSKPLLAKEATQFLWEN
ncbi:MAG: putative bifunctional diguanylate cyclase/phosphodiesterase [Velocimicrobium sp.]